jgi:hypothetical protein
MVGRKLATIELVRDRLGLVSQESTGQQEHDHCSILNHDTAANAEFGALLICPTVMTSAIREIAIATRPLAKSSKLTDFQISRSSNLQIH